MDKEKKKIKIGRNDPCPCSSGKKYKNCCLNKSQEINFRIANKELIEKFQKYNKLELLSFFAGLQLFPKNHTKLVRIEYILFLICFLNLENKEKIEPSKLINKINKIIPPAGEIGHVEDPVENLFTENIIFYGGNYIVYPGIYSNLTQIVQNLLLAIFNLKKITKINEDFLKISIAILLISNAIAKRLGQIRYMDSPEGEWREDIKLPPEAEIKKYSDAVVFSKNELEDLFQEFNISLATINPLIFNTENTEFILNSPDSNPLIKKPIFKIDNKSLSLINFFRYFFKLIQTKWHI